MRTILFSAIFIWLPTGLIANSIDHKDLSNVARVEQDALQVIVPSQFQMINGGASCGYQALFNGLKIWDLATKSGDEWQQAKVDITLAEKRTELFGGCSTPWRQFIITQRQKEGLKKSLEKTIMHQLGSLPESKTYENELALEIPTVSRQLVDQHYQGGALKINAQSIMDALLVRLQSRNVDLYLALHQNLSGTFQDTELVPAGELGNWLEPHEIYNLIEEFKFDQQGTPIFCVGSSINGSMRLTQDLELETNANFKKFQEDFQNEAGSTSAVFLLYTGGKTAHDTSKSDKNYYNSATSGCTNGHWYTVVANKTGAQRQYIVADSLNPNRLHHERFRELKALLEGYEYVKESYDLDAQSLLLPARSSKNSSFINKTTVGYGLIITVFVGALAFRSYLKNQQTQYRSKPLMADDSVAAAA